MRLLTSLGMSYEAAKKRAEPYTKIVELPEMRRDTVDMVQKALGEPAIVCAGEQPVRGQRANDGTSIS